MRRQGRLLHTWKLALQLQPCLDNVQGPSNDSLGPLMFQLLVGHDVIVEGAMKSILMLKEVACTKTCLGTREGKCESRVSWKQLVSSVLT